MSKLAEHTYLFATIAKLIAYFLIYQIIFVTGGEFISYLVYNYNVEPATYREFAAATTTIAKQHIADGASAGILLSSLAMITHLLVFKYVRISKNFLREVKAKTLVLSTLFVGSMMIVFNIVAVWLGLENNLQEQIDMMLKSGVGIISVAILGPILEELLFRGAIQGVLLHNFKNPWVGIIVASLLFGIIHGNPVQIFYATCVGVGFGWLYYRTGSLLPAIVGHITNNALAVITNLLYGADSTQEAVNSTTADVSITIVAAIITIILAAAINNALPPTPQPWHEASEE